jgi:hypothetical protein
MSAQDRLSVFAKALDGFYTRSFTQAENGFAAIADQYPTAAAYANKCRALRSSSPTEVWSGFWLITR